MNGYVRDTRLTDVLAVAKDMRPADVAEVFAYTGLSPLASLFVGYKVGQQGGTCRTICLEDGTPVGMYGISAKTEQGDGIVWMLAANGIKSVHRQFLREARPEIAEITKGYRVVYNYTDARNEVHHRWIKWAGFTIINRHEKLGYGKLPFLEFCLIPEETS